MEVIVNILIKLISESSDAVLFYKEEGNFNHVDRFNIWHGDDKLHIEFNDKEYHLTYNKIGDIAGICFDFIENTLFAVIKIKNQNNLIIHMLQ